MKLTKTEIRRKMNEYNFGGLKERNYPDHHTIVNVNDKESRELTDWLKSKLLCYTEQVNPFEDGSGAIHTITVCFNQS